MIEGCLGSIRGRDALRWQDEACVWYLIFTEMGAFGAGSRQMSAAGRGLFVL